MPWRLGFTRRAATGRFEAVTVLCPVYPSQTLLPGLGWNVKWTPTFFNQSYKAVNGASIDIGLARYPLHQFELTYDILRDQFQTYTQPPNNEWKTLVGLFALVGGSLGRFAYDNPDDDLALNMPIGIGDGVTSTFTLGRQLGATGVTAPLVTTLPAEPIGILNVGNAVASLSPPYTQTVTTFTPVAYINTGGGPVAQPFASFQYYDSSSSPTAPAGAQTVTYAAAPPVNSVLTFSGAFYYYCRFMDDTLAFEKFMSYQGNIGTTQGGGRWLAQAVKFQNCRAGA
jgi:Conserved hypothetical protein 2217 (DUF2460)